MPPELHFNTIDKKVYTYLYQYEMLMLYFVRFSQFRQHPATNVHVKLFQLFSNCKLDLDEGEIVLTSVARLPAVSVTVVAPAYPGPWSQVSTVEI